MPTPPSCCSLGALVRDRAKWIRGGARNERRKSPSSACRWLSDDTDFTQLEGTLVALFNLVLEPAADDTLVVPVAAREVWGLLTGTLSNP